MNTLTIAKTENRGRKFQVAKFVMTRAWDISRNAAVAHNTNPIKVAQEGLVKASEYFISSLDIAWREAKAKIAKQDYDAYKMHKVPKKSVQKILASIADFGIVNLMTAYKKGQSTNTTINKMVEKSKELNVKNKLGEVIFNARFSTPAAASTNRHILQELKALQQRPTVVTA